MFRQPTSIIEIETFSDQELTAYIEANAGRDRCRTRRGRIEKVKKFFKKLSAQSHIT